MGSLQNPFLTAFAEESLAIYKRPVMTITGLFFFPFAAHKRGANQANKTHKPYVCYMFRVKPDNTFAD
jgi:hypothetical protein